MLSISFIAEEIIVIECVLCARALQGDFGEAGLPGPPGIPGAPGLDGLPGQDAPSDYQTLLEYKGDRGDDGLRSVLRIPC
jgi:hypothetical protein